MIKHSNAYQLTYHNWHHMRDEMYWIPTFIFLEFQFSELEFWFLDFSTAEFEKKIRPESLESKTESEFRFRWGSQKSEPKIRIPNLGAHPGHSSCHLGDGGDGFIIGVVVAAFHHIVDGLQCIPILPCHAAQGHCCETPTVRFVDECFECWICLGGLCFPCIAFLEGEDVSLDKDANGVCNDLLIGDGSFPMRWISWHCSIR